jgi:hypothetical protein
MRTPERETLSSNLPRQKGQCRARRCFLETLRLIIDKTSEDFSSVLAGWSVSFGDNEMKHWREKLDEAGLKLIEANARLQEVALPLTLDPNDFSRWMREQKDILSSYRGLGRKRRITLKPGFVRLYLDANPELNKCLNERERKSLFKNAEWPSFTADCLELAQGLASMFENHPKKRTEAYLAVAGWFVLLRAMFSGALKSQFGQKAPNGDQTRVVIAQYLEWIAAMLRGRVGKPPGRANTQLAKLVNAILEHQKAPLTQLELYAALEAAGAKVPEDPEAFRLWLHRARKRGLVKNFRPNG